MKKVVIGYMERIALQEEIAREIYAELGYKVGEHLSRDYMGESQVRFWTS